MELDDQTTRHVLLESNFISEGELDDAAEAAHEQETSLADYLLAENIITRDLFGQALAQAYSLDYYDLNTHPAPPELVKKIPREIAQTYQAVTVSIEERSVKVAVADPTREDLDDALKTVYPDRDIEIVYSLPDDIHDLFIHYQQALDTRFADIIADSQKVAPDILDEIFSDAVMFEASDIHFEPRAEEIIVRFRVDGVLQEAGRIPKKFYDNILNRIKVMGNLRIDEHFIAQDGSLQFEIEGKKYDVRASIVPTVEGEKAVLRILTSYIGGLNLSNLGLETRDQKLLKKAGQKPFGMILVTGPTGSGKSTTLYSLLKIIDSPEVNITTIEDPVEYKLAGANQIQVDKEHNLSFSEGLRSVVRQDPDVVLVGEIRDRETAEISVNAALTGHLLLSTFHSNDAATAIPRLLEMGTEPFLLASTLEVLVAQRLVRKICEGCRVSEEKSIHELEDLAPGTSEFFEGEKATVFTGEGCDVCNQTGYDGRTAVFEIIEITPEMEELILERPSTKEVWELAEKQGSESMFADGMRKVKNGTTTLSELQRVTPSDDAKT